MTAAFVQFTQNSISSASLTSPTGAGNCVVVCIAAKGTSAGASISGVTLGGSAGNFAKAAGTSFATSHEAWEIWVDADCAGSQTAVAVAGSNLDKIGLCVYEFSGIDPAGTISGSNSGTAGTSAPTTGSASISDNAAWVGFFASNGTTSTGRDGAPWNSNANSAAYFMDAAYAITSGSVTESFSGTYGSAHRWGAVVAAVKEALPLDAQATDTATDSQTSTANVTSPANAADVATSADAATANVTSPAVVTDTAVSSDTATVPVPAATDIATDADTATATVTSPADATDTTTAAGTASVTVTSPASVTETVASADTATATEVAATASTATSADTATAYAFVTPLLVPTYPIGVAAPGADLGWWITPRPLASATPPGAQSVPTDGWVDVTTGAASVDRASAFAAVGYNVGKTLGIHLVSGSVTYAASTAGTTRRARVLLNGGPIPGGSVEAPVSGLSGPQSLVIPPVPVVATVVTDTVTLQAWQDAGTSLSTVASGTGLRVVFAGTTGVLMAPVGAVQDNPIPAGGILPTPGVPVFGAFSTTSYEPADGKTAASITAQWTQPLNVDGSMDVNGGSYELQWRQTGTTEWGTQTVAWDQTQVTVLGLALGTSYDFQLRAINGSGDTSTPGAWSATSAYSSGTDVTPPAQPAVPTVAASLIAVQVTHTLGLAAGGTYNLPADMDHLEVHLGSSSGFTTSSATLAGKLAANQAMMTAGIAAVGTFATSSTATVWVKVVAVDHSGNRSTPSSGGSSTATLIDNAHITDLVASKITAGTISAAVIIGSAATFSGALSAATGTFTGTLSAGTVTGSTVTGSTVQSAASGARVVIGAGGQNVDFYNAGGLSGDITAYGSSLGGGVQMADSGGYATVRARKTAFSYDASLVTSGGSVACTDTGITLAHSSGIALNSDTSVSGTLTATTWGISTLTMSGALTVNGSTTLNGTTVTLNPSGAVNLTATTFDATVTGTSTIGGTTVILGNGNGSDTIKSDSVYNNTSTFTANVGIATSPQGRLYRITSSARYKVEIEGTDVTDDDVRTLRPVTYYDRKQFEENGQSTEGLSQQLGLIAEDVHGGPLGRLLAEVDADGRPESVNYDRVSVALLPVVQRLLDRVAALERS